MYAKLFRQIFDSSISNDYVVRHIFMDLLALADRDGHVDMTAEAIARRTNVPLDIIRYALDKLNAPDPHSRTPDEEGRRIVLLDTHRDWGWRIVNYEWYRNMRDEEARKAYFREYKRKIRGRTSESTSSPQVSTPVLDSPTLSTKGDVDTNTHSHAQKSEPLGDLKERTYTEEQEEIPSGLSAFQYARGLIEKCNITHSMATQQAVSAAITALAAECKVGLHVSTETLIGLARSALARGETVGRFWFEDGRFKGSATNGKFINKSQQRSNSNIEAAANYIAEIDGREAAADFVRGATGQSERYSLEDLRKPALEAPDRGRAGSGHQPVTIEAPGGGNSISRSSHA